MSEGFVVDVYQGPPAAPINGERGGFAASLMGAAKTAAISTVLCIACGVYGIHEEKRANEVIYAAPATEAEAASGAWRFQVPQPLPDAEAHRARGEKAWMAAALMLVAGWAWAALRLLAAIVTLILRCAKGE
jgi:hypothetical protein